MHYTFTDPVDDPALFVGREQLLNTVTSRQSSFLILGEARIGKTSALFQLKRRLHQLDPDGRQQVPIYLNLRSLLFASPADVYRHIAVNTAVAAIGVADDPLVSSASQVSSPRELVVLFAALSRRGRSVAPAALIDNIDDPQQFRAAAVDLYSGLREASDFSKDTTPLRLVATASSAFLKAESSTVSKLLSRLTPVELSALVLDEVRTLLGKSAALLATPQHTLLVEFLFAQSGGHPCVLQELLVRGLAKSIPPIEVLSHLERICNNLATDGCSFFHHYTSSLTHADWLTLLAVALRTPDANWQPPPSATRRFLTAGLIREEEGAAAPSPSCTLFFRWFRVHAEALFPASAMQARRAFVSMEECLPVLRRSIATAMASLVPRTERDLQDMIQCVLAGLGVRFEREAPLTYKTKTFKVDFALPDLDAAIEIKLAKPQHAPAAVIDQVLADMEAYRTRYSNFVAVLFIVGPSHRLTAFSRVAKHPYAQFIVAAATE